MIYKTHPYHFPNSYASIHEMKRTNLTKATHQFFQQKNSPKELLKNI